ncbi:MAG: hypothetical protein V3W41_06555 [Planctomycetota bacterium]
MRLFTFALLSISFLFTACASDRRALVYSNEISATNSAAPISQTTSDAIEGRRSLVSRSGKTKKGPIDPKLGMPSKLVHDSKEVPEQVRAIEGFIDVKSAIIADEIVIEVSKNYQFDVSLAGDRVGHVLAGKTGTDRIAMGPATAFVRNLRIRGDKRIRLRIAGVGTKPFIRITAKGHCSHIVAPEGRQPKITRADAILIRNDKVSYVQNNNGLASAKPTAKTK